MHAFRLCAPAAAFLLLAVTARCELCPKCGDGMYTTDAKQCPLCKDGWTGSGAFKMCKACSVRLGQCERCGAALGTVSKVSPEQAEKRLAEFRAQMEREHPGCTNSPGAEAEQEAAAVVTKWFEAMNNSDVTGAMAVSATPFSWDRKVADADGLKKLLTNWVVDQAPKKTPLKFSAPAFLCVAAVKDVGEGLIWIVAFDQSGRTDDAITLYVKPGAEPKIVGFRD